MRRVFTIGHSTRSPEELLALLSAVDVGVVADVRAFPSSRRLPHFNAGAMATWLPAAGIRYVGFPELGGRRRPGEGSLNGGWRDPAFQGYADHMSSAGFAEGLARLEELADGGVTAIMCAEALWWRCHRRLIADALTVRGWRVEHLGVGGAPAVHELPAFAVVADDGQVRYPPAQSSLFGG